MNKPGNGYKTVTAQSEAPSSSGLGASATDWESDGPRLLGYKAASAYLSLSYWSVRDLVLKGEIPHIRYGKRVLIDRRDLDNWIAQRKEWGV